MSTVCNTALVQCWPGSWRCQLIDVLRELDLVLQSEWLWNPQQKPGFNSNLGPSVIWMNEWMNEYFIFVSGHLHDVSLRELFRHINLQQIISRVCLPLFYPPSPSEYKKKNHKKISPSGQMQYCRTSCCLKTILTATIRVITSNDDYLY